MVETQVKNIIEDWRLLDERLCDVCDPTGISNALTFDNVNACQCERFPCIHDRFQTKLVKEKPMRKKRFRKIKKRIEKHAERFSYLNICQEDEDLSKGRHNQKDLNLNLEFYCDFEKGNCLDTNENEMCCFEKEGITESDNNNVPLAFTNENESTKPDPASDEDDDNNDNENNKNIDIVRINNDKNVEEEEEEKSDNERRTFHSKSESCLQNLRKVPNENLGKILKEIETLSRSSSWESKVRYCDHKNGQTQKQKAESNSKNKSKKESRSDSDSDSNSSSSSSDSSSLSSSDSSLDSSSSSESLSSSSNSDDDSSSSSSSVLDSSSDEDEDDYNNGKGGTKKQKTSH